MKPKLPIRVVCATRVAKEAFFEETATGASLRAHQKVSPVEVRLFPQNSTGLGHIYNLAIRESRQSPAILVFMHDDVLITDCFWGDRVRGGLEDFDIVGLAGNVHRTPYQISWAFLDRKLTWDRPENLSGCIAHGKNVFPVPANPYGPCGVQCALLDGVFLAASSLDLLEAICEFDECFDFHFYDLDFCRTATKRGLRMGTLALSVIHESTGADGFRSLAWQAAYERYIQKWGD